MEEKINKLFALFSDVKNEQLFSLAVGQIVSIYNDYPACLYQILRKTNKLTYSRVPDPRLRLLHSQLGAGIIEKTYKIYCDRLFEYIETESDQIPANIFHFEPIQAMREQMQYESVKDYETIKMNIHLTCDQIDFDSLIRDDEMILGKDKKYGERSRENKNKEAEEVDDDEILKKIGISSNFNEVNIARIFQYLQGEIDFITDNNEGPDSGEESQQSSDEDAMGTYQKKDKNPKQQTQLTQQYSVINPFNVIFNRAVNELLSHKWQERRASAQVLRSIVRQRGFELLGFKYDIKGREDNINSEIRSSLKTYISTSKTQLLKMKYLLARCCVVIAMDRFADYISDQTVMVVREVACQIAITLLTAQNYKNLLWNEYPDCIIDFIQLMRQFLETSQNCGVYEVSQSALFLVHGLLNEKLPEISGLFSHKLLQVGETENVDEILILLAEIWTALIPTASTEYMNRVYQILSNQLKRQDDISFSARQIFLFLETLIRSHHKINCKFDEISFYKKFYFHRIASVKSAFYAFFLQFIDYCSKNEHEDIAKIQLVSYQHALFEEDPENFKNLALIFSHLMTESTNYILETIYLICQRTHYKQFFQLYDGMPKEQIVIYYPQSLPSGQIDSIMFRVIKTAHFLTHLPHVTSTIEFNLIKLILSLRSKLLGIEQRSEEIQVTGDCFNEIDLDIQVSMQELNQILTTYSRQEKEQEYLVIIMNFLKLYTQFALSPAHSQELRAIYPLILTQLKLLGTVDYEMDTIAINRLTDIIMKLVESLQLYNRLSAEMLLNFRILLDPKADYLIARIRIDKFDILQEIASQSLVQRLAQNKDCCDLTSLYSKPGTAVSYILSQRGPLKRKDFGKKRLMQLLLLQDFQWWHLFFERIFLSQLQFFPKGLSVKEEAGAQQIMIRGDDLKNNIWGLRMIQTVMAADLKPEYSKWAVYLLEQLLNIMPVLSAMPDEEINSIQLKSQDHAYEFKFDVTFKSLNPLLLNTNVTKLFAKLCARVLESQDNEVIDQVLELLHGMFKRDLTSVYDVVTQLCQNHAQQLQSVCGFLTLQTIKRMSRSLQASRLLGQLVPILTVQSKIHTPVSTRMIKKFQKAAEFQSGFNHMAQVDYPIVGGIKDKSILRDYQWDGIRWLGFLVKYNLHGALCDDMGLGKTLQTLAVIANEYAKKKTKQISLVIAPSTVVDHWYAECVKYIDPKILKPHVYQGTIEGNLLLISYNQMLKASQQLLTQEYFFLILDEAHILKNSKNKSSKIIRSLNAKHKIVLSGTPVQNHLLELWSLFDLLLQNYLGDEEYFKKHFSKAFHTNLFSLTNDEMIFDEQQTKTLKLLHQKVLPFIMRRTKQDVLPQLPPKIIEDYYCHLVQPLQSQLYELLDRNSFSGEFQNKLQNTQGEQKTRICESIFKLLQLLRQVLDHPFLIRVQFSNAVKRPTPRKKVKTQDVESVVNEEINQIFEGCPNPESYTHSGKMLALKDIISQLGFLSIEDSNNPDPIQIFTNHNKVLIFSRFRQALQMIAEQLLKIQFPTLQYLILDGSVPQAQRFPLVTKFNEDPDIRVFLLTTQVGGLGLNLSSANIVIMFDHDYNPVNDQQAMDRAHRIGQKNVVQVFRLIVKDTLEEKIMGIQRFKQAISKAIVNSDNASLQTMQNTDILSMLEANQSENAKSKKDKEKELIVGPYSKILSHLKLDLLEQMNFDKEF